MNKKVRKLVSILVLIVINLLIWREIFLYDERNALKVIFMSVGQGDAIFIETRSGNQVLIDSGRNDSIVRQISKELSLFDKDIDVFVATHPDADHIGGFPSLLERFNVGLYVESGNESDSLLYKSLEQILSKKEIKRVLARRNMVLDLGEGVFIKVLFPDRDVSGLEANAASVIVQLNYGDTSFMLTGDSPKAIENYLVSLEGKNLESEVLKLGHHGSKTSTSENFLGFTSPEFVVVSSGEGNRYGHPHEEVLSLVKNFDIEIFETSKSGSLTFFSDGSKVWLK